MTSGNEKLGMGTCENFQKIESHPVSLPRVRLPARRPELTLVGEWTDDKGPARIWYRLDLNFSIILEDGIACVAEISPAHF